MMDMLIGFGVGYVVAHVVSLTTMWGWVKAMFIKSTTTPTA